MKKIFLLSLVITSILFLHVPVVQASKEAFVNAGYTCTDFFSYFTYYVPSYTYDYSTGSYELSWVSVWEAQYSTTCTQTFSAGYGAKKINDFTLEGFQNLITDTQTDSFGTGSSPIINLPKYI